MSERFEFDGPAAFLAKLRELVAAGVSPRRLRIITPVPVPEAIELLRVPPSPLRWFTFGGALAGFLAGFLLPVGTVLSWPLNTGGKPLVSLPPFLIIVFELTILLGALASLLGFLHLSRLPDLPALLERAPETGNRFVIEVEEQP